MEDARVAVVVPVRNGERFLAETLSSVLAQTERGLEIVVVDDGSVDGTAAIASGFQARDSRVRLLRRQPAGVSSSRNAGARVTRASLLCFLDADDLFSAPDHLARCADFLDVRSETGLVYSPAMTFRHPRSDIREPYPLAADASAVAEGLLRGGVGFPMHAALIRRRWFDLIGGFDGRFEINEDTLLWLRLLLAGCRFAFLDGPPVLYRRHGSGASADPLRVLPPRIRLLEWLGRQAGVRNTARKDAVRSRMLFLTLVLSEAFAARGKALEARAAALRCLRWCSRPRQALELLGRIVFPRANPHD
jgi:glycosyltransferase involved in cell wall biosynthesis